MKLEAIIVCIGYDDFLSVTLPNNKQYFDRMVVVTTKEDKKTQLVCERYNVYCHQTDAFYDEGKIGGKPNKAKGINEGLKHLTLEGWVVQIDADIWLPGMFRYIMEGKELDPKSIYGIDRLMCNSYEDWMRYIYNGKPMHEGWVYLHLHQFPVGQRIVKYNDHGYLPIGFFQLWNPKGSGILTYPDKYQGFDRTDLQFAHLFPKANREFIPDFACIHLSSQPAKMGQNWGGRNTRPFLPEFLIEEGEEEEEIDELTKAIREAPPAPPDLFTTIWRWIVRAFNNIVSWIVHIFNPNHY